MNKIIYKYRVPAIGQNNLFLPSGARVLRVDMQGNDIVLWAESRTEDAPPTPRVIEIYATGLEFPFSPNREYINTFFDGPYVWHAYEDMP